MKWRARDVAATPCHGPLQLLVCSVSGTHQDKLGPMGSSELIDEPARCNHGSSYQL
jgi:hypothetical protein